MSIVITEDRGAVRHVILNRPEKRNAMSQELLRALAQALREAAAEESVHCVVLRGEGKVFSAGVDLVELGASAGDPGQAAPLPRDLPGVRQPLRRDGQAGDLPDPPHLRRRRPGGRARLRPADRLRGRPVQPARGEVRDHPRRRRLQPPAGGRRPRPRQGADHDRAHDRRRRGRADRPGQPRRRARGSRAGRRRR